MSLRGGTTTLPKRLSLREGTTHPKDCHCEEARHTHKIVIARRYDEAIHTHKVFKTKKAQEIRFDTLFDIVEN